MSYVIAIKLGSSNTSIFKQGEGLVLFEPTMVAYYGEGKNKTIIKVGSGAKRMQGRTDNSTIVKSPIIEGKIADPELATIMVKTFLHRVIPQHIIKPKVKAIVCVPIGLTAKERKLIELVLNTAGIQDVVLIPAIMAGAVGYNLPISDANGLCLVNIGGGSTDIVVSSVNSIISGVNVSIGGQTLDRAIEKAIENHYQLKIGDGVAEKLKEEIGSLYAHDASNAEVGGVDSLTAQPKSVVVDASIVYSAIVDYYDKIASAIQATINSSPANVVEDIQNQGIYIMGGASLITGLEQYLRKRLNLPVLIQDQTTAVDVLGAGKLLSDTQLLKVLASL